MELFISFSEIMHFFRRNRVKFLLVVLAFGLICGLMPLKFYHVGYSTNSTLTISCEIPENATTDYRLQYTNILNSRVQTAIATAGSNDLIKKTAAKLGIQPTDISKITGEQVLGAPVVKLTVQTTNGARAAEISDTAAQILSDEIVQEFPSPKLTAGVTDKALPVKDASKKSAMLKGGILGLVLGFLLYVVYGLICVLGDRSVRNSRFAEESLKTKLLGEIPHDRNGAVRADAFRKMRAVALHQFGSAKCVVVESVSDGDGGEETAAGLAVSLAQAGKRVLAVDANLREPKLAEFFGVQPSKTFNDVLKRACPVEQAVTAVPEHEGLSLISGVKSEENPSDLLAKGFKKFVSNADPICDYLVVYAPSESSYPDADSLMEYCAGGCSECEIRFNNLSCPERCCADNQRSRRKNCRFCCGRCVTADSTFAPPIRRGIFLLSARLKCFGGALSA